MEIDICFCTSGGATKRSNAQSNGSSVFYKLQVALVVYSPGFPSVGLNIFISFLVLWYQ